MKDKINRLIISTIIITIFNSVSAQKKLSPADMITLNDLESYVSFLASPYLKGRQNGEPGLELAQQYIVSQSRLLGLKPANGTSYYQPYTIVKNSIDPEKTKINVISKDNDTVTIKKPVYQLFPTGPSEFTVEGVLIHLEFTLKKV